VLFAGGGLAAIPSDALERPAHEPTIYLLPLLAIVSGIACWLAANHVSRRWLHLVTTIATLEVAITVWLANEMFAIYYVFVAIYSAYMFQDRRAIAAHVAFASLAVLAPLVYRPEDTRETLILAFILVPTLAIAAGAVAFLRERLEASEARFRELAERDPLTGVGNYRLLRERFPIEMEQHRDRGAPLSLIVIDLDEFKRVNDEHGHQYGDRVLQDVAGALIGSVRSTDLVVRHGGDEFSIVCPDTTPETARELAARLCEGLAEVRVDDRPVGACTGHAVFPDDAESLNALLAHADRGLRDGKASRSRAATRA
jgi:diguanylate cyclase (GGDEF)-like protein